MKTDRGLFLSILIIIFGLAVSAASILLIADTDIRQYLGTLPGWFSLFVAGLLVARLAALYGIWNFKRIGVYALLVLECIEVGMGVFVFTGVLTLAQRALASPAILILAGIWFLALRPKWKMFT